MNIDVVYKVNETSLKIILTVGYSTFATMVTYWVEDLPNFKYFSMILFANCDSSAIQLAKKSQVEFLTSFNIFH